MPVTTGHAGPVGGSWGARDAIRRRGVPVVFAETLLPKKLADALARQGTVFDRAYTTFPASIYALLSPGYAGLPVYTDGPSPPG